MMYLSLCVIALLSVAPLSEAYSLPSSAFSLPGVNRTFDYVVVGGGNAGAALASRLAQDGRFSVAVVEAGGFYESDNGNNSIVPGYATLYSGSDPNDTQPLIDWGFVTTPQTGAGNRAMHYARGKTLGGSSARNFMVYQRPTVGSMQQWADQVGDQGYTFANTLPFFEKSVNLTPQDNSLRPNASNYQTNAGFSKSGGPLQASYGNYVDSFATWVRLAFQRVGQKAIDGFNTGNLIGSAWATWTIEAENGQRSSSESSFLRQAVMQTTTLQIYTHSLAEKVLFNGTTAVGILVSTAGTYGTPGKQFTLKASKEIIVSAGAFQSPQLLMVSGVGPKATLQAKGIPVIKDAPGVGQNLWDQTVWPLTFRVKLPTTSALFYDPKYAAAVVEAYNRNGTGLLSEFGAGYIGWEKLPEKYRKSFSHDTQNELDRFPKDWPEAEYLGANAYLDFRTKPETLPPVDGTNYAGVAGVLITPASRGNVTIGSSRMSDPPIINPNYLVDPADQQVVVAIFKRQRDVYQQLKNLNITYGDEVSPGPSVQTDSQILKYIQQSLSTIWHAAATCKMGKPSDQMAVVDSQARVIGTQRLRVVDASAFPFLPPGHPQSVVYMLAEKIAAQILQGQ